MQIKFAESDFLNPRGPDSNMADRLSELREKSYIQIFISVWVLTHDIVWNRSNFHVQYNIIVSFFIIEY